jgi:putative intracellular protease/amidase
MKTALLVLTSRAELGNSGRETGSWLEELAGAWFAFVDGGWQVELASVKGGAAPLDPMSLEAPWLTATGERLLGDAPAMQALSATPALADIMGSTFDVIYLIGGAGGAWDFPDNPALARLLARASADRLPIGAVCHGSCGLLNTVDGIALAARRQVTCVSNEEERLAGFDTVVPLLPQTALAEAGATVLCTEPFAERVVEDGLIVTGQNPASAAPVAVSLMRLAC